jgi:SulP family sulfate permease
MPSQDGKEGMDHMLKRILPFMGWFKGYNLASFRLDAVAGVTVALVLIPQSMAYAQLAGLPAYYGLYAAFLPPMIAAMFGSSMQLATGPVAIVSLMTAASLEPLATAGSEAFLAYAVLLALIVGIFQLLLGVLRLGLVVNFLSHPVVNGFTNAAAIIIASSQLSKMFGVYVDKAPHHYETIWRVCLEAAHYTHWPTWPMGRGSLCRDVRSQVAQPAHTICAGRGGAHHGCILCHRFPTRPEVPAGCHQFAPGAARGAGLQ